MPNRSDKGLIVKKIGMTRVVDGSGQMVPVTLLQVADQKVTKILSEERDGYHGYQIGFFPKSAKNLTKADMGRLRKVEVEDNFAKFKEFRTEGSVENLEIGGKMTVDVFKDVASIDITGVTKGRGFQGAVKRWGASIGRMTHGSRFHRRPGSLGQCTTPGRVFKNKHQPGHMGASNVTVKNIQVLDINTEANTIAIKGSVPGHRDGYLTIRPTNKK